MSAYAIRAWRDSQGKHGVTIGTVYPAGYENYVVEFDLDDSEIFPFLIALMAARGRAQAAPGPLREKMPGPYEAWPDEGYAP